MTKVRKELLLGEACICQSLLQDLPQVSLKYAIGCCLQHNRTVSFSEWDFGEKKIEKKYRLQFQYLNTDFKKQY